MAIVWASALAEYAAATATLNSRALHRAGLLEAKELSGLHEFLDVAEEAAQNNQQRALAKSLRNALPPRQE